MPRRTLTVFRLLNEKEKATSLLNAVAILRAGRSSPAVFSLPLEDLARIPSSPLAYWVPSGVRKVFGEFAPFENPILGRIARCGLSTLDDNRFLRLFWEAPAEENGWCNYYHGGVFSPFYDEFPLVVRWLERGKEMKTFVAQKVGSASRKVQGQDQYFQAGFVFSRRTKALAPKLMPSGGIFSTGGQAGFVPRDELLGTIAILSSRICSYLISTSQGRTGDAAQFEVGLIKRLPWPYDAHALRALGMLAIRAWSLKRSLATSTETSRAFTLPALLQAAGDDLIRRAEAWSQQPFDTELELARIQLEIDARCFDLYGIGEEDRGMIASILPGQESGSVEEDSTDNSLADLSDDGETDLGKDTSALIAEVISWIVGVTFGRFDIRLANGSRALPAEPEPFDPLPMFSPGILAGDDGLPLRAPSSEYPLRFPADGLLVDDSGHPRDLVAASREVFEHVFPGTSDARWIEAATLLDPSGHDLRRWLSSEFFEFHLKRYSKGRRKAPIYWQLATPSRRYSIWLYAHRLTRDTFFHVQQDLLGPKLALEERKLLSLTQAAGPNPTANQRKELAEQETFVEELRAMRDEVARVAPLWNPDHGDGVVITMAPLWRLVPQHRAWQRELQSTWEALAAGKYDWAHLAMYLWPERVVPKCAEDRSLAIAHGLEDVFWEEGSDGKWKRRLSPSRSVEELVRERTSPAVKDALKSLMEAPAPGGGARATRSRSGRASGGR